MTVSSAVDRFMRLTAARQSRPTWLGSYRALKDFVKAMGSDTMLHQITPIMVENFVNTTLQSAPLNSYTILREFLKWSRNQNYTEYRYNFRSPKKEKTEKGLEVSYTNGYGRISEDTVYISKGKYLELSEDLIELRDIQRPDLLRQISEARAAGDVSENSPLDAARAEMQIVDQRIRTIERQLSAAVTTEDITKSEEVRLGSRIQITNKNTGREGNYQIVSEYEVDVWSGKISVKCPVAQALLGLKAGVTVKVHAPRGEISYSLDRVYS